MQEAPWVWLYALVLETFWHPTSQTCQVPHCDLSLVQFLIYIYIIYIYTKQAISATSLSFLQSCCGLISHIILPGGAEQSQALAPRGSQRKDCGVCVDWQQELLMDFADFRYHYLNNFKYDNNNNTITIPHTAFSVYCINLVKDGY